MATEPFLVNPPKRLWYSRSKRAVIKRRRHIMGVVGGRRKRRRNPIGETLVTIGANPMGSNPWYGDSAGHRIAALMRWGKIRKGKVSRHRRRRKHSAVRRVHRRKHHARRVVRRKRGRWAPKHIRMRRKIAQQSFWTSKYGHMLAHPRSKKVYTRKGFITMATRRRRRRKNTWFGQPRRHRKAARKGWRRGHLIGKRGRRRRIRHNPVLGAIANPRRHRRRHSVKHHRRHHRRHRRNPAITAEFGKFTSSLMNFREWAPLAVTGGLSAITGAVAPSMIGVDNPWAKLGVQTAVAIGGGIVVERFVGHRHGQAWMIVGVAMVGYQLLKQFVFMPYFPQFAVGLGGYNDYYPAGAYDNDLDVSQQVGAFPQQMSAFPGMSGYPGVGGSDMSAYPYDGTAY